jgi:uncharacterized repeat protein (TIGR03806 family)
MDFAGRVPRTGLPALLAAALAACGGGSGGDPVAPTIEVRIADASVAEGNSGTSMRALAVTLSEASDATVTVGYATGGGTATAGSDYQSVTGALSFPPGQTAATLSLPVVGDTADEPDETVVVTLADPLGATLRDEQATVTILDDDGAALPSISIGNATVTEGNAGSQVVSLTVSLSVASAQSVSVNFGTANGTAASGSDYTAASGTLTFSPGQVARSATVTVLADTVDEANETVLVNLSGPVGATVADGQGVITITDDDGAALPTISISNASVAEGDAGTTTGTLTVSLSTTSAQTVTVAYSTANGTATAGSDYVAASSTVSFAPGQTSRPVNVTVNGDTADESAETVLVNLASPTNATIADAQGVLTITDDDSGFGLDARPSNPDCVAPARGTAATGVATVDAFPAAPTFSSPTKILQAPGDGSRWFVLEQSGRIRVFSTANPGGASTWLDLTGRVNAANSGGLLGMAFHPDFPATREVYVSYTGTGSAQESRISRFILDSATAPTLGGSTEQVLLRVDQSSGTHKGGDIAFGPDDALYISIGDASENEDPNNRGQNATRLAGKFLRIGVLGVAYPSPGYSIPPDNPYAANPRCGPAANAQACPEIYALGFRNPWRWSFDPPTDTLWVGDVGEKSWEEINQVELGGNYGWSCREGGEVFNAARCSGGVTYVAPAYTYAYGSGGSESVTGGVVYRGSAIPFLAGRYVFADFVSGRIWALSGSGPGSYTAQQLLDTTQGIVAFALGEDGEIYYADYSGGTVNKLVPAGGGGDPDPVPDDLAATGCVSVADPTQPAAGLVPYDINAPFWSDNAVKSRWIGLPDGTTIARSTADWSFPAGTVLMKNFRLGGELVETRLLMRHPDGGWAGYTYEWNDAGTAATRVRGGKTKTVAGQQWLYPSESQCMQCHTVAADFALGPETRQLNRSFTYPSTGRTANQLETLDHVGMFSTPLPGPADTLATMADPADAGQPLAERARAWLHSNCAGCHRPSGPTTSSMDLRYPTDFAATGTCDVAPAAGSLGIANARLIAPGDAARSVVIARMARRDVDGMPPIGSFVVDAAGQALLSTWVNALTTCP